MSVRVIERCDMKRRCFCGALLAFNREDMQQGSPPPGARIEPAELAHIHEGLWPWIRCPECGRAVVVGYPR